MKKLIIILVLAIALISCKKEQVCVSCIEKNINYQATDFCGTPFEAETYIDLLVNDGWDITDWECTYN